MNGLARFQLLLAEIGLSRRSSRSAELLLANDIVARIHLHPSDEVIVVTLFFHDGASIRQEVKRAIFKSFLLINSVSPRQGSFYLGVDDRSYLTLIGLVKLKDLDQGAFLTRLHHFSHQAQRFKTLVETLSAQ